MSKQLNILLICGGQSEEHSISLVSAQNVLGALGTEQYHPYLVIIDQTGVWHFVADHQQFLASDFFQSVADDLYAGTVCFEPGHKAMMVCADASKETIDIDVAMPLVHGSTGEDGVLQGFLQTLGFPYVGSGVLSSALCMDKVVSKALMQSANIPVVEGVSVLRSMSLEAVKGQIGPLGLPVFIKPASSGSSMGVSCVKTLDDLADALADAFKYGDKVLIERTIIGREIELAVLGNQQAHVSTVLGEVKPASGYGYYSYDAKYLDEGGAELVLPAQNISAEVTEQLQACAMDVYRLLCCQGMARIDFFLTNNGQIYVNEVNTIPGFTKISMYPKLLMAENRTYHQLIDELVQLALEK